MSIHRRLVCALLCAALAAAPVFAAECPLSAVYDEDLTGICVTAVPERGTVLLGSRTIRSGDVLTAAQLARLTFQPDPAAEGTEVLRYLPIGDDGLKPETELVFSIRGKKNEAPSAENSSLETYKNLPNEGLLSVRDPENDSLTFTLVRPPKRGEVILRPDGSFLYTPKKNKVGTDSFTFTATDPSGNVSQEATVTIEILKPSDSRQYADTTAADCRFEAEWLRNTGIFTGETVSGRFCFSPDEAVSRGQFLAMLMQVLDLPVDRGAEQTGFLDDSPAWLKPYLAAALRSGIIQGYPANGGIEFRPDQSITGGEAALMVSRALDFACPAASMELPESDTAILTRSDTAKLLYRVSSLKQDSLFLP